MATSSARIGKVLGRPPGAECPEASHSRIVASTPDRSIRTMTFHTRSSSSLAAGTVNRGLGPGTETASAEAPASLPDMSGLPGQEKAGLRHIRRRCELQIPDQLGGAHPGGLLQGGQVRAGRQVTHDPGDAKPLDLEFGFSVRRTAADEAQDEVPMDSVPIGLEKRPLA